MSLKWQDVNYAWRTGWNTNQWYIDYPCDGTNTYCFNGVFYNAEHWSTNKPQ